MRLGKFAKAPDDRKRYTITYTDWLDAGETIENVEFTVDNDTLTVDGDEINGDGNIVSFFVSGGDDGVTYNVLVEIETSGGQIKEDLVLFAVQANR